jgi:hypothetical protein
LAEGHRFSRAEKTTQKSCGRVKIEAKPGKLVIFARQPTLRERRAW